MSPRIKNEREGGEEEEGKDGGEGNARCNIFTYYSEGKDI